MGRMKLSKRNRSIAVGLACGLLCALCVGVYVTQVDERAAAEQAEMLARYGGDQIDVCVARRDIAAGETISDSDIDTKTWIATLLPSDAVTDKREAIGRQVGSTILSGEVISSARFGFESSDIEVPDGMVAVSVPSREVQAVGGAIAPGMVADVYAVGPGSTAKIASSAPVLATSMGTDAARSSASAWVTLAVRPSKVQELVSAAENLQLYFVLPSPSAAEEQAGPADAGRAASLAEPGDAARTTDAPEPAGVQGSLSDPAGEAASLNQPGEAGVFIQEEDQWEG